jgi:polyhydroxyalkanoate synthesis regulator phasin
LKTDILGYAESLKNWIGDKIDKRVHEVMDMMKLAGKEQISNLNSRLDALNQRVDKLEKITAVLKKEQSSGAKFSA